LWFYDSFMMVLDVIIVGPFLLDPSSQAHGRCVAGLDCPKGDVFFLVATMSLVVIWSLAYL
jgi:hypothetical protein